MVACGGTYLITPLCSSTFTAAKEVVLSFCFVVLLFYFILFYFVLWFFLVLDSLLRSGGLLRLLCRPLGLIISHLGIVRLALLSRHL